MVSISSTFYEHIFRQYFGAKNYKAEMFAFETQRQKDIGKKIASKMLMKLTPGLNFINILCTAFTHVEPKTVKKTVKLSVFLRFWDLRA